MQPEKDINGDGFHKVLGGFEKHTKGIGMKLMEKMGYRGGGLGKNQQGIVAPIEAKLRPKNMGMGFEKKKKKDVCEATETEFVKKRKLGEEEIVRKVRGPQVRVFTSLENLNADDNSMRKLLRNVKVAVDSAENDMLNIDKKLGNEREMVIALQEEKNKFEIEAEQQQRQLKNIEEIIGVIDQIAERSSSGMLSLESLADSFHDIQEKYPSEFKLFSLSIIACSLALSLFIRVSEGWDPLQNPSHGIDTMARWKDLLQSEGVFDSRGLSSPYTQLVMEVVVPAVRMAGINTWDARYPDQMIRFIEMWERLLPPLVLNTILDEIVFPKLSFAVERWDPRSETVPIHCWIHPWLPLLSPKLETLHDTIQRKLGTVLLAWHPSDGSAFTVLSPWKNVFDTASWDNLMVRYIVPKLQEVMRELVINPADQKLHQFDWVMSWASVVPIHHMVTLLEVFFFSKWQQVLYQWLSYNPDFEEITQWYKGWKARLPAELLANERIRYQFHIGLDMMNKAVEGRTLIQPGLQGKKQFDRVVGGSGKMDDACRLPEMSLKQVLEAYAQRNELLFKLKPGRMHDGHQIYGFGSVNIIIDSLNERVYAKTENAWSLVYLEQLLDMHRSAVSKRG